MKFGTWEIVTITLVVIALITCIILFYFLVVCYVKMQATQREVIRWRDNELSRGPVTSTTRLVRQSRNRSNSMHAVNNDYLPHPMQRAPQRHTINNINLLSNFDLPVMRFYTAEELLNFPFDEHQRDLAELIAAAELSRASREPEDDPVFSYHPHRSMPPQSTIQNISRRLSESRGRRSNMNGPPLPSSAGRNVNSPIIATHMTLPNPNRSIHTTVQRTMSAEPTLAGIPETKEEHEARLSLTNVLPSGSPPPYDSLMAPHHMLESELQTL